MDGGRAARRTMPPSRGPRISLEAFTGIIDQQLFLIFKYRIVSYRIVSYRIVSCIYLHYFRNSRRFVRGQKPSEGRQLAFLSAQTHGVDGGAEARPYAAPPTANRPPRAAGSTSGRATPTNGRATPTPVQGDGGAVEAEMHVPVSIVEHKRRTGYCGAAQQRCSICRVTLTSHCCSVCSNASSIVAICRPEVHYQGRTTTHRCLADHREDPAAAHLCVPSMTKQRAAARRTNGRGGNHGRGAQGRGRGARGRGRGRN